MKKSFLTLAAIALMFSFTSCKETSSEDTTEDVEVLETETPTEVEVIETQVEVDTTSMDAMEVEEKIDETPAQ